MEIGLTTKTILDRQNREIVLTAFEDEEIVATHNEKEIGSFEIKKIENKNGESSYLIVFMNVIKRYKRSGIGTEIFLFFKELLGKLPEFPSEKNMNSDEDYYLVDDGVFFAEHIKKKYA